RTDEDPEALDAAAELLAGIYQERARLVAVSASDLAAAKTAAQTLELLVDRLAAADASVGPQPLAASGEHERIALRYLAADELQYTAALQRQLLRLTARHLEKRLPGQALAVQKIEAQTTAAANAARSVLVQLREQEAGLLKLWML